MKKVVALVGAHGLEATPIAFRYMSVFLFRVKGSAFDRAQAKDGQPFVLNVKYDPLLDSCGAGDVAIICTEVNKSAPACFALSACHKDKPLRYSAKIVKYDSTRKDSHKLLLPTNLEQYKNLTNKNNKVYSSSGDIVPEAVISTSECEGMDVTVENPQYSFQVETNRCNLLQDGELVIESDTEDTQAYRKIEDEQYVMAIQSLIKQKAESTSSPSSPDATSPPSDTPNTTISQTTTQSPTQNMSAPQPPPAGSHKPKPAAKTTKSIQQPAASSAKANGNGAQQGEKRESDTSDLARDNKKPKVTPDSSPLPSGSEITPVGLLMHVTSVAGMLKELDSEHSERLTRLEEEVTRLKQRLGSSSLPPSPTLTKESTPVSTQLKPTGPGRKKKDQEAPTQFVIPPIPAFQQKTQKPADPLRIHKYFTPGEFIAVRVDPTSSTDGYWMARVIPGAPKQGLVRVKWFEKYAPLPGWYFMDTREDLVDPLSIFHRNFELIVKPWKNRAGHFIGIFVWVDKRGGDIYRPAVDVAAFDTAS